MMVQLSNTKLKIILLIFIVLALAISLLLAWMYDKHRLNNVQRDVLNIATQRINGECLKESIPKEVCDNLNLHLSTMECKGRTCWVVLAKDVDQSFFADVTVEFIDGDFVVSNYHR